MVQLGLLAVALGAGPTLELNPGAVGAVYVVKAGPTATLRIVFPAPYIENPNGGQVERGDGATIVPVTVVGELVLFDEKGVVQRFRSKAFKTKFWCENDGGRQTRAEAQVSLKLERPIEAKAALQQLAGFVVVAKTGEVPKLPALKKAQFAASGDLDGDGAADVGVVTAQDEAGNCDGKPKNNLTITLMHGEADHALRCCGP